MPSIVIIIYLLFNLIFYQKTLLMNGKKCWYMLFTNGFLLLFEKLAKQVIKFPCMEGQYLGLFRQYLTCVFVHRRAYKCIFSESDAYQTISSLLGDHCWGVRHYKCNQVSYVVLFIQTTNESSIPALDALIAKKAAKKKKKKKKKIILVIRILL